MSTFRWRKRQRASDETSPRAENGRRDGRESDPTRMELIALYILNLFSDTFKIFKHLKTNLYQAGSNTVVDTLTHGLEHYQAQWDADQRKNHTKQLPHPCVRRRMAVT